jgi:lon-related putative ATP-dependent protease
MKIKPLPVSKLRRICNPRHLKFKTTDDLPLVDQIIGQPRAVRAIDFGIGMRGPGFNVYVAGPSGSGRTSTVARFVRLQAENERTPDDWVYVHNFNTPLRPRAMNLPPGRAKLFKQDLAAVVNTLQRDLPAAFETDEYQQAASKITRQADDGRAKLFEALDAQLKQNGFLLGRSEQGLFVSPEGKDGQPITPKKLAALPIEKQETLARLQPEMEDTLEAVLRQTRSIDQAAREQLHELDRRTGAYMFAPVFEELINRYQIDCPEAADYLSEAQSDITEHIDEFRSSLADQAARSVPQSDRANQPDPLIRFAVNVLVEHSETRGAPVVVEMNPTFMNLIGRIERDVRFGDGVLDFTMLSAGALHRANGGYLIMRAQDVMKDANAWEALKRALNNRSLQIEDPGTQLQLFSTRTLESEAIPLDVKVILLGARRLYYDLYDQDEDFHQLFKVKADFATDMDRTPQNERAYAQFVRARCAEHELPPFEAEAVAEVIEFGSRLAEDQRKLSTRFGAVTDLVLEAAQHANAYYRIHVTAEDVCAAQIDWRYRSNLAEQEYHRSISDGTFAIQLKGSVVGQINGLSVIDMGEYQFGQPARISVRTYVGRSGVISIEREAHLSGRIYNKGVLILEGYLGGHYAIERPLTLAASISFEQNYSEIEGDSATSAELYALLSSLANLPIKQSVAVTGAVDQQGHVMPIGGAQYKIEGFFDICNAHGLTGDQGVMIPFVNVRNLMLREDVVEACRQKKFHIWAVKTIDEGLEMLTGVKAGQRSARGVFPKGSVHDRVQARLKAIADQLGGREKDDRENEKPKAKQSNNNNNNHHGE